MLKCIVNIIYYQCIIYLNLKRLGIAEKRGGKRSSENVWGSAATVRL